jgi:hypothetical protein
MYKDGPPCPKLIAAVARIALSLIALTEAF